MHSRWRSLIVVVGVGIAIFFGQGVIGAESAEDVFWTSVRKTDSLEEYEIYIATFPKGKYLDVARTRIELMRARETANKEAGDQEAKKAQAEEQPRAEADHWERIRVGGDISGFQEFVATYPSSRYVPEAQQKLVELRRTEAVKAAEAEKRRPGKVFRDCQECPEMVILPTGSFRMGSPESESWRETDEGPQHQVTISYPLAVGKYEVTFEEWAACSNDKVRSCEWYDPPDSGWGRGRMPVTNVSWDHAQNYVTWLSGKTGKPYRLLSEAEWEYAARGGTSSPYSVGDCLYADHANFSTVSLKVLSKALISIFSAGSQGKTSCQDKPGSQPGKAVKVGSYPANSFGLHDMMGNVLEWVQDCWEKTYSAAPTDGSAYAPAGCLMHVRRGGAWDEGTARLRSAARSYSVPLATPYSQSVGFRVALTLGKD